MIVALILLSMTFVTPWYRSTQERGDMTMDQDYYFDESKTSINDREADSQEYDDAEMREVGSVFDNTRIFVISAMVGTILGIIGALLVAINIASPKIGAMLVIIGFIFAIIAPIYMAIDLPNAFEKEWEDESEDELATYQEGMAKHFFGSSYEEINGVEVDASWGGSTAWFLAIIAAFINLIAFGLVFTAKPGPESSKNRKQQASQGRA
ncbi:MAG: hypothetical protein V5A88_07695 [Candidatus Thermoplasmatota archaeon]